MRRWKVLCLSCGTSLERIAPESLTRLLFEFVHWHMSRHPDPNLQNEVFHQVGLLLVGRPSVNRPVNRPGYVSLRLVAACGRAWRIRYRDKLMSLQDTLAERRRERGAIRDHQAGAGDRREPQFAITQIGKAFYHRAALDETRDPRYADRPDRHSPLIALV